MVTSHSDEPMTKMSSKILIIFDRTNAWFDAPGIAVNEACVQKVQNEASGTNSNAYLRVSVHITKVITLDSQSLKLYIIQFVLTISARTYYVRACLLIS